MKQSISTFLGGLSLCAAFAASPAMAVPVVWLAPQGDTVQVKTAPILPTPRPDAALRLTDPVAVLADGKTLAPKYDGDALVIAAPLRDGADMRLTAKAVDDAGVLNLFEARAGRSEVRAVNDLELVPTEPNGTTFKLVWKGNAVPAGQVDVETSAGWRRTLRQADDGTVSLTSPEFRKLFPGRYVLTVTAKLNGKMTVDGKTFDTVMHTATLTFDVPAN